MQYIITNTRKGWLLKIWEPAPPIGDRQLPFLFKVNSIHATHLDAIRLLAHYEEAYR